jgi:quercetin dioxygenase-like cupin family protein
MQQTVPTGGNIEYQTDSVVSKTVINRPGGNVTLFAFDRGQGLSEHTAPYDAMVFVLEGKAEVKVAGQAHVLSDGQYIIMPANAPHALTALEAFKMLLVMIKS